MNKPVAWMDEETGCFVYSQYEYEDLDEHGKDGLIPLYTQEQLEEARKLGMQQERALWELAASTQEIMDTHPVKELTDEDCIIPVWMIENLLETTDVPYVLKKFLEEAILRKAQE